MDTATLSLKFLVSPLQGTYMRVQKQDPPWRAIRAFQNASGESLVHLHNVSGGILGGDRLELHVGLEAHARAQVTSVGATRIYRQKPTQTCSEQRTIFNVAEGALLEYLPDPIIPYADAKFNQSSEFHLAAGSGLIAWEILSAGRTAHGESFSFDDFTSNTTVSSPNRLLALERYALRPKYQDMRSPTRFGRFEHSATMWVCLIDDDATRWPALEQLLSELANELSTPDVLWGASALVEKGIVIRGLACEAYLITKGLEQFWRKAKQSVWNRAAVTPRKVH